MMNGELVKDKTKDSLLANAATQIAAFAAGRTRGRRPPSWPCSRGDRPPKNAEHFAARLADTSGDNTQSAAGGPVLDAAQRTEFSWNH